MIMFESMQKTAERMDSLQARFENAFTHLETQTASVSLDGFAFWVWSSGLKLSFFHSLYKCCVNITQQPWVSVVLLLNIRQSDNSATNLWRDDASVECLFLSPIWKLNYSFASLRFRKSLSLITRAETILTFNDPSRELSTHLLRDFVGWSKRQVSYWENFSAGIHLQQLPDRSSRFTLFGNK